MEDPQLHYNISFKVRLAENETIREVVIRRYYSIDKFKEELQRVFGVPISEQVLVYSNRELTNQETIEDLMTKYHLSEGDLFHLFWVHVIKVEV